MQDIELLNLTGLPLSIDSPTDSGPSIFTRTSTAYITDQDRLDQVVRVTIPSSQRRISRQDPRWQAVSLEICSDRSSIRTDKVPLLDKVVETTAGIQYEPRYKAFWKRVSKLRN